MSTDDRAPDRAPTAPFSSMRAAASDRAPTAPISTIGGAVSEPFTTPPLTAPQTSPMTTRGGPVPLAHCIADFLDDLEARCGANAVREPPEDDDPGAPCEETP